MSFVCFANEDKEHFKNIHIHIYKHFPRGNANVLDLNKTVIENWTVPKKVSMLLFTSHKK